MTHSVCVFHVLAVFVKIIGIIFLLHIFPADIPILHRRNVRRQEPAPPVRKNDAGLLYGIRYTVIGRYDSRHPETDYTKRSE